MKICIACNFIFDDITWQCPSCSFKPGIINGYLAFAPELADKNEGFNPEFFENLYNIEPSNFWFRSRNRLIIWALQKYFPEAKSLLEIGCSTGFVLSGIECALPKISLSGSEIHSKGLAFASKRLKKATLFQMDARNIPFADEFDVIGAFDVLEHIKEDTLVIAQIYKTCKKGGIIIITVPQHQFLWSSIDDYSYHFRRYNCKDLITKVEAAGFKAIRVKSFVSLLLPLMIISRAPKRNKTTICPGAELRMGKVANYILEKILDVERFLISLGVNFPCGGSLLLVAHKE